MTITRVAIIGAGPGGFAAAVRAARCGAQVTLVEAGPVGGTCLNRGCIPSKVMKATADLLETMRRADEFGISAPGAPAVQMARLMARKQSVIASQADGMLKTLKQQRIDYCRGKAAITEANRIDVQTDGGETRVIHWDRLIIATGTCPRPLPATPFDGRRILSSDHILDLETLPASIVIIGGGVIGCEFAFILSALGAAVTVVEALPGILQVPGIDADAARIIQRELKKRKIPIWTGTCASDITLNNSQVQLRLTASPFSRDNSQTADRCIEADLLLACIGRCPDTAALGLDTIGVQTDENGWIVANDRMETTAERVYAVGDILGPSKIMLAHVASAEGEIAAENAMGSTKTMPYHAVPSAVYTMPELGSVGMTSAQAVDAGKDIRVDRFLFRRLGKAHVIGHIAGEVIIISEKKTLALLGVHIVGPHATDLIAEAALALSTGCTARDIAETIHAHPTLSEAILETARATLQETPDI